MVQRHVRMAATVTDQSDHFQSKNSSIQGFDSDQFHTVNNVQRHCKIINQTFDVTFKRPETCGSSSAVV